MTPWIQCGDEFLEADVIRWKEAIWEQRGRGKGRAVKIGEREVVAEVLREDDDGAWVRLLVRACTLLADKTYGRRAHPLKPGEEIRRKRTTLARGHTERLAWSDESVREALAAERQPRPQAVAPAPKKARKPAKPRTCKKARTTRRRT
jgi:hypothetical protein